MIPNPAQFLTDPSYAGGDEDPEVATPLERLADLERRVIALEGHFGGNPIELTLPAEGAWANDVVETNLAAYEHANDQLLAKQVEVNELLVLVNQIGAIVKKSTSKVSLDVKAAIEAWRFGTAETPSPGESVTESRESSVAEGSHTRTQTDSGPDFCRECSEAIHDWVEWPCPEQPVEEWRAYARSLGRVEPEIDTMNRSQIRTMLGIEQPVAAEAGA